MNKNFQNLKSKSSRFCKHFLKALGGATVSTLSLLSLCLTSAQAASFVTTFETNQGDMTLEWSGSDSNVDGTIDLSELSGPVSVGWNGNKLDLGSPESWWESSFSYDTSTKEIDLDTLEMGSEFTRITYDLSFYKTGENSSRFFLEGDFGLFYIMYDGTRQETEEVEMSGGDRVESTPEPTLTLGLITLGGLMLGSKRKKKA